MLLARCYFFGDDVLQTSTLKGRCKGSLAGLDPHKLHALMMEIHRQPALSNLSMDENSIEQHSSTVVVFKGCSNFLHTSAEYFVSVHVHVQICWCTLLHVEIHTLLYFVSAHVYMCVRVGVCCTTVFSIDVHVRVCVSTYVCACMLVVVHMSCGMRYLTCTCIVRAHALT